MAFYVLMCRQEPTHSHTHPCHQEVGELRSSFRTVMGRRSRICLTWRETGTS